MAHKNSIILSLGSNIGERHYHLQKAIFLLGERLGPVSRTSKIYRSEAWGFDGAEFFNACASLETSKEPEEVLNTILQIEKEMGRGQNRGITYQNRIIDIDLLYYNSLVFRTASLSIPHPHIQKRKFVLKPLADIAPQFYHPVLQKDSRNLLQEVKDEAVVQPIKKVLYKSRTALFTACEFITIEGNIGAGKTSLTTKIASDFKAKKVLERFSDNPFLPSFYKDQQRYAFPLEMSFLADRYQQFTEDTLQPELFTNFMVSDYDINKSLIFARITLAKEEFLLFRKLFNLMYKEVKKPKMYVYLYQTTDRLLENIAKRGRPYESGITKAYLEKINRGYFDFLKTYPKEDQLILDISELNFVENTVDYHLILDRISEHLISQKTYIL